MESPRNGLALWSHQINTPGSARGRIGRDGRCVDGCPGGRKLALYRSGRHAEALAIYREAWAALDEIGLQPGPELRALEQAILRHDPFPVGGRTAVRPPTPR
ncbi:MAG: BTAD domain-containing putative transcriptional regulator [Solirubrobacteraceae bacterium]